MIPEPRARINAITDPAKTPPGSGVRSTHCADESLRRELLAMAGNDLFVREELIAEGSLGSFAYYPRMPCRPHASPTV